MFADGGGDEVSKVDVVVVFGCDSSPRSPNVSMCVCVSVGHTLYNCTKALNFKVFRLKDFRRTSKGLPKSQLPGLQDLFLIHIHACKGS